MGTASYVLVGGDKAMTETFGSACHGAGRVMSRRAAIRRFRTDSIINSLLVKGIYVRGAETESTFIADIQPLKSFEQQSLSIGRKDVGMVKIYTDSILNINNDNTPGDVVVFRGKKYEVVWVDEHGNNIISHNKYIAMFRGNV